MKVKEQTSTETPITFSESAMSEIIRLTKEEGKINLRVGAKNGGCSGFSYIFEFDEPADSDKIYTLEHFNLIVDPMHLLHIKNLEVDYEQGLNNRGFTFSNPNAKETCGCGTSFS